MRKLIQYKDLLKKHTNKTGTVLAPKASQGSWAFRIHNMGCLRIVLIASTVEIARRSVLNDRPNLLQTYISYQPHETVFPSDE